MVTVGKKPGLLVSLVPIVFLIGALLMNIIIFKDNALGGANQIALLMAAVVGGLIGIFHLKLTYKDVERKVIHSIGLAMQANLILLVVGMLIGLWIFSGVVPSMVYYGVKIFNPGWFLPLTCLTCCIVSIATGSSWSTGGTVGIAFIGVGQALNIPVEMVAGAVISGAYFGDKMSPLSDTTNLAPAMAGTDLFTHVKYMIFTTGPSILIALTLFTVLGLNYGKTDGDLTIVNNVITTLDDVFNITPLLFILPGLVFFMVAKRIPALPALIFGCLGGALFILIFQYDLLREQLGGEVTFVTVYGKLTEVAFGGFKLQTGNTMIDDLLSRGGMGSMLNTVWLILTSMTFGGVMEVTGMLAVIGEAILKLVRGTGSLIAATIGCSFVVNLTASDQYLSLVLPGRMFKPTYEKFGLAPQNLSRSLEDGGTITSVLIPWNTCGAYFSTILGVSTFSYLPYAFFNLVNPIVAIIIATVGWKIARISENEEQLEELPEIVI